jgi:L-alanine-DL-glutamate epimerase-like enolase superfamily enzyme
MLARVEQWPIAGTFAISRGTKTQAAVVVAELSDGNYRGRGECVPYARYGETADGVVAAIEGMDTGGLDRERLQLVMPAGAARNALDCAFWDLAAKCAGRPVHQLIGQSAPSPLTTAYTISLAAPQAMGDAAARTADRPVLKVKLGGGDDDPERIACVRRAAPRSMLIVDANEGWTPANLPRNITACAQAGVVLIEQPLPASDDHLLATTPRPVAICADESVHDRSSLAALQGKYDAVNIKLDKAGGLTEALALAKAARERGFTIMVGCMVSTSLALAPAVLLAQCAKFVDLDGAALLAHDRPDGLTYSGSRIHPPRAALWG